MDFEELKNELKVELDQNENLEVRKMLYRRGYLITNRADIDLYNYPFYSNWSKYQVGINKFVYVHNDQHFHIRSKGEVIAYIVGHAYNPFNSMIEEDEILDECIDEFLKSKGNFFDKISELSGIHLISISNGKEDIYVQDCTGSMACNYGINNGNYYLSSNCALVYDVDRLTLNEFSNELVNSFEYTHLGTEYLPGDVTIFNELSRLGPNLCLIYKNGKFNIERFFPLMAHNETNENDAETLNYIAKILKNSVRLCSEKWNRPAISLTGGTDSRTTFSAANGSYDRFMYYSFYCKPQEHADADAAHSICEQIGVKHTYYPISENNDDFGKFNLYKKIIARGLAYINMPKDHEIRKYIFLSKLSDFDVELKSWSSEIGRAYWEKRFNVDFPEKLTPRHFSIFQTRFLIHNDLMKQNDQKYREFFDKSKFTTPMFNYEGTDMFYWEYRFGAFGVNCVTGQNIFNYDVAMPMNNRKFMDMFLWFPHEFRKKDMIHKNIILINEPKFKYIESNVKNAYFSNKRVMLEKIYYKSRMMFYKGN